MTISYVDTYLSCPDMPTLEQFARGFTACTPIRPGIAATAQTTDPVTGAIIPAQAAIGDPSLYYVCVRSTFDISLAIPAQNAFAAASNGAYQNVSVCDAATGKAIAGVFS
ncbi:MAG: hypothetical protein KGL39_11775 [Patescibacteria group bacterium]|nr:hypothetical protein [Patescibacteria group bacterium]